MFSHEYRPASNCENRATSTTKVSDIYGQYQYMERCDLSTCAYIKSRAYLQIFGDDDDDDLECDV